MFNLEVIFAVLIIGVSVGMGVFLASFGKRLNYLLSPIRTFAFVSATIIVVFQLLPNSLGQLGLKALLAFFLGTAFPYLGEKILSKITSQKKKPMDSHRLGLELGFVAFLIHRFGDGVVMGSFTSQTHAGHGHWDLVLAIGVHGVPLCALFVLAFWEKLGKQQALWRAGAMLGASLLGMVLVGLVPFKWMASLDPWITASVAGLLLHVILHDWQEIPLRSNGERLIDFLAIILGVALMLFSGSFHTHPGEGEGGELNSVIWESFLDLSLETAPVLLLGLVLGAVIQSFGFSTFSHWLKKGNHCSQAIRGALVGAPMPICACGVLPLAQTLRNQGAGPALVIAFLLATPELGIETFALTIKLLGWPFAVVRLIAAVALAIFVALVVSYLGKKSQAQASSVDSSMANKHSPKKNCLLRVVTNFNELLHHVGPWTVVGLLIAAYVQVVIPEFSISRGWDILLVTVLAIPSYVCAVSATPLAAVLLSKGMSSGAVLVGLLLGPATNIATIGFLKKNYGKQATLLVFLSLIGFTWGVAFLFNEFPVPIVDVSSEVISHQHGLLSWGTLCLLALIIVLSIFRSGLRHWIHSLGEAFGPVSHKHSH